MKSNYVLRDPRDFRRLFGQGRRLNAGPFRIFVALNGLAHARFAFLTPRSIDKRAVVRNTLRRRAREWIRAHPNLLCLPFDIAILFKKEACTTPRKKLYEELSRTFSKIYG